METLKDFFFIRSIIFQSFWWIFESAFYLSFIQKIPFIYDELFLNDHILFNDELVIVVRPWKLLSSITFEQVVTFLLTENWQVKQLLLLIQFWYHELHGCSIQWYSSKSELSLNHMMFWTISTNSQFDKDRWRSTKIFYIFPFIIGSWIWFIVNWNSCYLQCHKKKKFFEDNILTLNNIESCLLSSLNWLLKANLYYSVKIWNMIIDNFFLW